VIALALAAALGAASSAAPELTVFAAASLREAFGELGAAYERSHPGWRVRTSFAGSQELRMQLDHGASADVFASADERQMRAAVDAGRVERPRRFARNALAVVVPDRSTLRTFADLAHVQRIVLGAHEVPIGRYADEALARAEHRLGHAFQQEVLAHVVSRELDVGQVLAKVALGEADAAIVYRTDVRPGRGMRAVALPADCDVVAAYWIALVVDAAAAPEARAYVEAVLAPEGQRMLAARGFLPAAEAAP
jgi:molybdate transport system substrate-binding protein